MNKTNGYSFADSEAPKVKSDDAASLADKIGGSLVMILSVNGLIWSPMFFIDNRVAQIAVGFVLTLISLVATFFVIKFLKKHWHILKSHRSSTKSAPFVGTDRSDSIVTSPKYSSLSSNIYNPNHYR